MTPSILPFGELHLRTSSDDCGSCGATFGRDRLIDEDGWLCWVQPIGKSVAAPGSIGREAVIRCKGSYQGHDYRS